MAESKQKVYFKSLPLNNICNVVGYLIRFFFFTIWRFFLFNSYIIFHFIWYLCILINSFKGKYISLLRLLKNFQLHFACNNKENQKYFNSKNSLIMYPEFFVRNMSRCKWIRNEFSLKFIKNLETSSVSLSGLNGHIKIQENSQI